MNIKDFMRKHKTTYAIGKAYRFIETNVKNVLFMIQAEMRRKGLGIKKYEKLLQLKDAFQGERCFIIATGPSLTETDILSLKNEYTFSMNAMCLKYKELNWRPTFYGIQDAKVFHKLKEKVDDPQVKYIFVDDVYRKEGKENWVYFPRNSCYNSFQAYFNHVYKAKFSNDVVAVVYEGFSITLSLIQIAVYLGFKEIYLLGCDCNYVAKAKGDVTNEKNYFVNHGVIDSTNIEAGSRMIKGYEVAKEYAKKNGIKIYNATRGGALEVFERVNLEDIL